ncbi:MAG: GNAT family N-acetyltransferase, partial [Gammaproteobacteria bacterium]
VSGIILHRSFWRLGFATEVFSILLQYGFETLGLENIKFYTMSSNKNMIGLFDKLGIRLEKETHSEIKKRDFSTHGEIVYSLTSRQWKNCFKIIERCN